MIAHCQLCGSEFKTIASRDRKFCSRECGREGMKHSSPQKDSFSGVKPKYPTFKKKI